MSFGGHLRALREQARLSRAELARRAGVPVSTLHNWENDRGFPGLAACLRPLAPGGALGRRFGCRRGACSEGLSATTLRRVDTGSCPECRKRPE